LQGIILLTYRQTDREADGGTDRQTGKPTDMRTDRQTGRLADWQTDRQTGRQAEDYIDGQTDRPKCPRFNKTRQLIQENFSRVDSSHRQSPECLMGPIL
jgi:hypothetical protein